MRGGVNQPVRMIPRKFYLQTGEFVAEYIQHENSIRIYDNMLNKQDLKDFVKWAMSIMESTKIKIV